MVLDRNIRQRDVLFDLGSLTDIRQVQIVLCGNGPAKSKNGETKSKWLKRECFHDLSDYPSQIFGTPLPDNYKIFLPRLRVELTADMLRSGCFWYAKPTYYAS